MLIHVHVEGKPHGPYSPEFIREYLREGRLRESDPAWYEGAPDWMPLCDLPGLIEVEPAPPPHQYHHVAPWKFVVLSVLTLGFYHLYWFYRNWKYVRRRDGASIMPFWRAVFGIIWCFPLARDIQQRTPGPVRVGWFTSSVAFVLLTLATHLPGPWWMLTLLSFVPLCGPVLQVQRINEAVGARAPYYSRFGVGPVLCSLIGGLILATALAYEAGVIVSTRVVSGAELRPADLRFLHEEDLLEAGEEPLMFYSTGMFSIADEGNLLTDRRVVSYLRDYSDGLLWVGVATFEEIQDVRPYYSEDLWEDSEVFIQTGADSDDGFYLALSNEEGGDREFVDKLFELWWSRGTSAEQDAVEDKNL